MRALILVDIQNDFLPGGALAVPAGDQIFPLVNNIQSYFPLVVATQDWHPADHGSFAANHEGKQPGDLIDLHGLPQVLWPVHCVQGSAGAEFAPELDLSRVRKVFPKGTDSGLDSYSGFFDNGHSKSTGLEGFLRDQQVDEVYIVGYGPVELPLAAYSTTAPRLVLSSIEQSTLLSTHGPGNLWVRQIGTYSSSSPLLLAQLG